jgi:hypothetical protein
MTESKGGLPTMATDFVPAGEVLGSHATPVETILAGCWSGAGFTCAGCGQPPSPDFDRAVALGLAHDLPHRFATLLGQEGRPDRGADRGARSVLEPVYYASGLLAFAVSEVQRMTGREHEAIPTAGTTIEAVAADTIGRGTAIVLSNLFACSDRLIRSIEDTTDRQWSYFMADYGVSVGQLVWLALHGAVHHLEDAELTLAIATGRLLGPRS